MDVQPQAIVDSVRDPQYGNALLHHPRNKNVKNTSGAYYYINEHGNYATLKGLLPRLRETFWPASNNAYRQMADVRSRPNTNNTSTGIKKKQRGRGRYQGVITGTEVHQQLRDFVILDDKNFRKVHGELHPWCARLMEVIAVRRNWLLFLPEFDIYDEALRIGTSIDMVCLDKEGCLILLEFKTGYKDYFDGADGK